jgi:AraC family transcriptional regulator
MEPKIISKKAFLVIGIELKTTTSEGKNFIEMPQFWQQVIQKRQIKNIPNKKQPDTVLGICMDFKTDGAFSYIIGSEVTHTDNVPDDMVSREILEANYAVFTARGKMPDSIQNMIKYIYQEWLPKSNYQHAYSPEFELYDERSDDSENAEVDIYIPIVSSVS